MKPCTKPVAADTNKDVERKLKAVEAVKLLWKRKHFDEKDWKWKRTGKRLITIRSWKRKQKISKLWKRQRTRKHKSSRGAGSGSIKNMITSTSLIPGKMKPDINLSFNQHIFVSNGHWIDLLFKEIPSILINLIHVLGVSTPEKQFYFVFNTPRLDRHSSMGWYAILLKNPIILTLPTFSLRQKTFFEYRNILFSVHCSIHDE